MKRILSALLLLGVSGPALSPAWAQEEAAKLPSPYMELGVGVNMVPTVSTQTYTLTSGPNTATGRIDLDYDTGFAAGAEVGYAGLGIPELRFGVGYDYLEGTFSSGKVVGSVNGASGSFPFTRADITALGASLDNVIHLVSGNVYYSLPMVGPVRPYFGVGAGSAFISHADAQFALTATAGFRMALTDQGYFGLRYRFYRMDGPVDNLGIHYEPVMSHSVMAILGAYLD
jgi:opacity protein-like surface antigen